MVEAENELTYYLSLLDCPAVVCHLFLDSFIAHQQLHSLDCQKIRHTTLYCSVFLPILGPLLVQGFILERGPTIFKLFKNTICNRCVHIKVHWKKFNPFYPPPFSLLICPPYRIKRESDTRFSISVFFHESVSPGPLSNPLGSFRLFRKFAAIIANECLSAVSTTPAINCSGSVKDTGDKFFGVVNDTGD